MADVYERIRYALDAHQPSDAKEEQDVQLIQSCLTEPGPWLGDANRLAHLTGSAFVMDPLNRVLFTFHRKLERWLQLGGHSERYERCLSQTALREAREESGLNDLCSHPSFTPSLLDVDVHWIPAKGDKPAHQHLDFRYVFLTCMPERIIVSSESIKLKWFSIDEALGLDVDPALSRALKKLRLNLSGD